MALACKTLHGQCIGSCTRTESSLKVLSCIAVSYLAVSASRMACAHCVGVIDEATHGMLHIALHQCCECVGILFFVPCIELYLVLPYFACLCLALLCPFFVLPGIACLVVMGKVAHDIR